MTVRWQLRNPVPVEHRVRLQVPLIREPLELQTAQDWRMLEPETAREVDNLRAAIDKGDFRADDSWSLTKRRAGQAAFREKVLELHGTRCSVCGLAEPRLLDACHVVAWKDDVDNRLNPANGLPLCVLHHRALDRGILAFTVDGSIRTIPGAWQDHDAGLAAVGAFAGAALKCSMDAVLPFLRRSMGSPP